MQSYFIRLRKVAFENLILQTLKHPVVFEMLSLITRNFSIYMEISSVPQKVKFIKTFIIRTIYKENLCNHAK